MNRSFRWGLLGLSLALVGTPPPAVAQGTASVTGRVVDSVTAQPVSDARVTIVGRSNGTLTDRDGRYLLQGLPAGNVTVRVQRIGFAPADRTVTLAEGGTTTQDFSLVPAATVLSEVVVTGYGTSTREDLSGAVASVQSGEFANTPLAGVDAAIQGRAAGVQVIQNAGNPGVGITVRIRGSASISASNQPLYVIDGVPMLRDEYSQLALGGQDITAITGLNPDEIENIDILKDAASAAIYGSRASNGVVMITTKRGQSAPAHVSFNMYAGTQDVPQGNRWDLLTGKEYVTYMNEAAENDGYGAQYFGDPNDPSLVNTDWQAAMFRTAPVRNLNLSVTGGSDRVQYFVSGSQFNQEGVVVGSGYDRQAARVNVDLNASRRLRLQTSLSLSRESHQRVENDDTIDGVVTNAIAGTPTVPVRKSDGSFTSQADGLAYSNPLAIATYDQAESRSFRAFGNVQAIYQASNAVTLNGRVGMDVLNLRDLRWLSPLVKGTYSANVFGESIIGNNTANRYVLEGFVDWKPHVNPDLALGATGGGSVEWNASELDYLDGIGFSTDQFQYPGNAATVTVYNGDWTGHNLVSFFSRANATWKNRYLFTASLRADGSSRFGENNRYGVFPAVSFAWQLTREPFMQSLARHGELKLRASYGVTGNQDIADDFAPRARFAKANYGGDPGIGQRNFGNPDLRWEQTHEVNLGFDALLLRDRLTIVGDWYRKETQDLLLDRPISATSGQTTVLQNIGNMENKGFELTLDGQILKPASPQGLRWNANLNVAWNHNKVTKLFENQPIPVGGYDVGRIDVGHPLGAFYTLHFTGVDPANGNAIYEDVNKDGVINDNDRVYVGSPHPDYWGGFTNQFGWDRFDLRAFFQFTQGQTIFNAISVFANDGGYYYDNKFKRALRRWQKAGDVTDEPRASFDGTSGADLISSRYMEDGSYVRLQEITLGYNLPTRISKALQLTDGRLYFSGRNLYTWTKYSGYSPDVNSAGSSTNTELSTEFYAYPSARSFMIGLSGAF
ncbi:MAG TPA: TonB-dependent receptor [Gemmatimonadales bacterium]|nr:TonB-dependent receptor [Gemmatimonadales bacterium]